MNWSKKFVAVIRGSSQLRNGIVSLAILLILLMPMTFTQAQPGKPGIPNLAGFPDPTGVVRTFSRNDDIDLTGPFFQSLGTNGRSCGSCHQPSDAMSISAEHVQARFDSSLGLDPIFRTNDGSNCDHNVDVSTLAGRSAAYSLLRTRGLIRIALDVPTTRDFEVVSVNNPYGCSEMGGISMYRRPLPTANLKFLSTLMFDGRESSTQTGTTPISSSNYPRSLLLDLAHQSVDATTGHAQGIPPGPTAEQQQAIVAFEMALFTGQAEDHGAGNLSAQGANGGPQAISQQGFFIGINDPVGLDPTNPVPFNFSTKIFNIFDAWQDSGSPHRQAIARGQTIFNTKTFTITGVAGLNGTTFSNGVTGPQTIVSSCGICHDTPNVGNHSVSAPLNIGVADTPGGNNALDTSYLPEITICQKPSLITCVHTTDPGRAMITGKFADVGKFKGPILRGLAARAPYFHNGSAQTLEDIVTFYDARFHIGFTVQEKLDLVAFLNSL
jgi:cytochrome c peroxidase